MTRRTTRIAALGAGALMALGIYSATPAGATDGAQADATVSTDGVSAETTALINQALGLANQACNDATAGAGTTSANQGISVSAGSLLGGLTGQGEGRIDLAKPLEVTCTTTANGTGGLSVTGVEALVDAIAPGVDVRSLDLDLPALGLSGEATAGSADPGAQVSATAATKVPASVKARASSASVRSAASAPAAKTSASASATPASASGGIVAETAGSPAALARTGAGVSGLGLLGTFLFGGGRLFAFGRKFLR